MIEKAVRVRVDGWKSSLLDPSTRHGLLDCAPDDAHGASLALPGVDPVALAAALADGGALGLEVGTAPALDRGWLRVDASAPVLARTLGAMRRAALDERADRGVHTLWLALGLLTWRSGEGAPHTAPLALYPVELTRDGATLRLQPAPGLAPCANPVLVGKLARDFDLVLVASAPLDVAALLEAAEGLVVTRPGWHVERTARLGRWSFADHLLWQDLEARGDDLLASPVLAQLAGAAPGPFAQPSRAAAEAVTRPRPATELLAPLDADASQLAAVTAAATGATFVLQGAPGTGSSQTIANLVAHCISHGKTVLFVSPKVSALEVVRERLAAAGIAEFCLALTGHETAPAPVLTQLRRVLDRAFRPGIGPVGDDARLAELRATLDGHVAALHKVGGFGRSLDEVLGRLTELATAPMAPLAERDAVGLDRTTYDRRRAAIEALAQAAVPIEPVSAHPWRASALTAWTEDAPVRIGAALEEAAIAGDWLAEALGELVALVPGLASRTRDQLTLLGALAAVASASPRPGGELLTHIRSARGEDIAEKVALIRARGGGSLEVPRDPITFLALAHRHRGLAAEVGELVNDAIEELDASGLWAQLRKWSASPAPMRFVALRTARAQVRAVARAGQLLTDEAAVAALEAVVAERACRAALEGAAEPARRWFGELGGDPLGLALARVDAAVGWAAELRKAFDAVEVAGGEGGRAAAWRALVAHVAAGPEASEGDLAVFARVAAGVRRWLPAVTQLADVVAIDAAALVAGDDHVAALRDRVATLRTAQGGLPAWVTFHAARHAAVAAGVGPAVAAIERGELGASEVAPAWERATLLTWAEAELDDTPALARFHGAAHHAQASAFADLDRGALALARSRALVRLAERVPRTSIDATGELALLMQELRTPTFPSVRALLGALPQILPRLAPCLLMTPAAVAQALPAGLPAFDVVVIDHASLLTTAEAAGALARGTSAVIVGDPRQRPPVRASASLLADALAAGLPSLALAWHYRSRHEDLFAFANQRYHGDRLHVFPTAAGSPDLGIISRRVDGTCDRLTGTNRLEAEVVVADLLARLRDPGQRMRSIAVVTFTAAQAQLIGDLLDEARAADPEIAAVLDAPAVTEPLLIGTAPRVQGEARDVVLVSIGLGRDAARALVLDDGLLGTDEGALWLGVAVTRAREQLVLVTSLAPDDVPSTDAPVLADLATLLAFAAGGGGAGRPGDDARPASPLTAALARALTERGWSLRHRVGCGAYQIDLAVVDPSAPERYVLAIEADGPAYASAPAARDRDRLRPLVLGQLGWRLHRVWSLDWWIDPEREIQRAHGAIVAAIAANRQRRAPGVGTAPTQPRMVRVTGSHAVGSAPVAQPSSAASAARATRPLRTTRPPVDTSRIALAAGSGPTLAVPITPLEGVTTRTRIARGQIAIGPYTAAAIPNGRRTPDDLFAARHAAELGKVIEQVLAAEAPMHIDLLARRVGGYFGIGRVTQRVMEQVRAALAGRGTWGDEADVVWRLGQDPQSVPAVRVAGHGTSARRDIGQVPLTELASAARIVVERAAGIGTTDLIRDAARLIGYASITPQVAERVTLGVRLAVARELIRIAGDRAVMPD